MNSPTARYACAVVSSSALCSIWMSGSPRRIAVDPASASRAIDAPSTRSKRQRRLVADGRLHRHPGRQAVDVDLAELRLVRVGDAQPERMPGVGELLDGHAERVGGLAQGVDRPARPLQGIAGEPEQPAAALGLHHLLGGEAEAVQVFDQRGSLARIGDSGGLQRIEIDHPPESASVDAAD